MVEFQNGKSKDKPAGPARYPVSFSVLRRTRFVLGSFGRVSVCPQTSEVFETSDVSAAQLPQARDRPPPRESFFRVPVCRPGATSLQENHVYEPQSAVRPRATPGPGPRGG